MTGQPNRRKLIVLGSTGSIGVNTLQVVEHLNRCGTANIDVVGLAAGRSAKALIEQARQFGVRHVAIADDRYQDSLRLRFSCLIASDHSWCLWNASTKNRSWFAWAEKQSITSTFLAMTSGRSL